MKKCSVDCRTVSGKSTVVSNHSNRNGRCTCMFNSNPHSASKTSTTSVRCTIPSARRYLHQRKYKKRLPLWLLHLVVANFREHYGRLLAYQLHAGRHVFIRYQSRDVDLYQSLTVMALAPVSGRQVKNVKLCSQVNQPSPPARRIVEHVAKKVRDGPQARPGLVNELMRCVFQAPQKR